MCDILHDIAAFAFAPLSIEHVPEQAPPLIEKTALGTLFRKIWRREVIRSLGVNVILGIAVRTFRAYATLIALPSIGIGMVWTGFIWR